MKKRFLTIFYYKDIGRQHLYKDVGSIPLGLAKYCGWESSFAYVKFNDEIHDQEYEKFVSLIPIMNCWGPFISILLFLKKNAKNYDVINYYHFGEKAFLIGFFYSFMGTSCQTILQIRYKSKQGNETTKGTTEK